MPISSLANFHCRQCGSCCRVSGYVNLQPGEEAAIAQSLGLDAFAFTERFTVLAPDRRGLVLREHPDGGCILLDDEGRCMVHDVKPRQCRDFPFSWRNADSAEICPALAALEKEKTEP
ncbi:MAG: YkgJ family cysteine cluster protein [Kiritimatiellia bacterium]|jgi:Fe-S-cluster containining protein